MKGRSLGTGRWTLRKVQKRRRKEKRSQKRKPRLVTAQDPRKRIERRTVPRKKVIKSQKRKLKIEIVPERAREIVEKVCRKIRRSPIEEITRIRRRTVSIDGKKKLIV